MRAVRQSAGVGPARASRQAAARAPYVAAAPFAPEPVVQTRCACGGGCPRCKKAVQPKLEVSEPDDQYEQEADRVAEQVMRMPDLSAGAPPRIQRMCAECEEEAQRKQAPGAEAGNADVRPPDSGGRRLSESERGFFEPRFGRDFSAVRVHTDDRAAESAEALGAYAFTTGRNIVFARGQYAPQTSSGRHLLAHELAHVVQQAQPALRGRVQRLVRRSLLVGCGDGQNPFSGDRRASELLTNAIARIDAAVAARPADPANADVVAVGNAMRTAFRLNPANDDNWNLPAPHFGLPLIRRRLEIARDYIDSVVFTFNCCTVGGVCPATCGTCAAGEEAFVCAADASTITLCPPFWAHGRNQRGRVLAHEVMHITFRLAGEGGFFIRDWGQPDRRNAHCYAQFAALLNGFNSPAGFRCH